MGKICVTGFLQPVVNNFSFLITIVCRLVIVEVKRVHLYNISICHFKNGMSMCMQ